MQLSGASTLPWKIRCALTGGRKHNVPLCGQGTPSTPGAGDTWWFALPEDILNSSL